MSKNNRLCVLVLIPRKEYSSKPPHLQYVVRHHPTTLDEFVERCLRFEHPELKRQQCELSFAFGWEDSVRTERPPEGFKGLIRWNGFSEPTFEAFLRRHLEPFFLVKETA